MDQWTMRDPQSELVDAQLRGKTLQIYWYLLRQKGPVGVREVQRGLVLSSPSIAHHHLEKLLELGVVEKDEDGRYIPTRKVEIGVLQAFSRVGKFMLPRYTFYAVFFASLLGIYAFQYLDALNPFAIVFGAAGTLFFSYEAIRTWRVRPT